MARKRIYGGGSSSGSAEEAFAKKLNSLMLAKGWGQSDVVRAGQPFVPKGHRWARDLISAWSRAEGLPNPVNMNILSKVFGVPVEDLVPQHAATRVVGRASSEMQLSVGASGLSRLKIDMELPPELAMQVLTLVREGTKARSGDDK